VTAHDLAPLVRAGRQVNLNKFCDVGWFLARSVGQRFAEFRRVLGERGKPTDVFRGVNGTAGAVVRSFTPVRLPGMAAATKVSILTFHDPLGVEAVFFGPEADVRDHRAAWQLWKVTDAANASASVGGPGAASDPGAAISQGYDALGRLTLATDSALVRKLEAAVGGPLDLLEARRLLDERSADFQHEVRIVTEYLAIAIAAVINIFNPTTLFVHGTLLAGTEPRFARVVERVRQRTLTASLAECTLVATRSSKRQGAIAGIIHHLTAAWAPAIR
jgi:hypothetical protein